MNFKNIKRFNFTMALPEGAWLEDSKGNKEWFCFKIIKENLGQQWLDKQAKKQGWMTGCWIDVE